MSAGATGPGNLLDPALATSRIAGSDVNSRPLPARPGLTSSSREHHASAPVVVAAAARFEGFLTFHGEVRVDGEVRGEILSRGTLSLGASSVVRAVVEVDELIIAGDFEGDAIARVRIELQPTARVKGLIRAPLVALADGARLEGRCQTGPFEEPSETSTDEAPGSD